jgi:hypothetical protein
MHYVTRSFHPTQNHKYNVTCLDAVFMQTSQGPPEHEKWCIDVSQPKHTGMHYVTYRSHQMQKYKFGVTCLGWAKVLGGSRDDQLRKWQRKFL